MSNCLYGYGMQRGSWVPKSRKAKVLFRPTPECEPLYQIANRKESRESKTIPRALRPCRCYLTAVSHVRKGKQSSERMHQDGMRQRKVYNMQLEDIRNSGRSPLDLGKASVRSVPPSGPLGPPTQYMVGCSMLYPELGEDDGKSLAVSSRKK